MPNLSAADKAAARKAAAEKAAATRAANKAAADAAKSEKPDTGKAAAPVQPDAPKSLADYTLAERVATHAPVLAYMRSRDTLAKSPQIHSDNKRRVEIRTAGHRDAEKSVSDLRDRTLNLQAALAAVYGDKPFFAAGLDNSIAAMLLSAGLLAHHAGGVSTVANGVTTLRDGAGDPVFLRVAAK